MKVLFTVDNYFYRHENGQIYSKGLYPYSVWQRYLTVFDDIIVAARVVDFDGNQDLERMNVSSGPNVEFVTIPELNSPIKKVSNYNKSKEIITKVIQDADCLIARIPSEISSLAIKQARKHNKPWSVEVVSCTWDAYWNHGSWKGKIYAPLATLKTKSETKNATHALYVTKSFLQQRYPSKGKTINCSNAEIRDVDSTILENRLSKLKENQSKTVKVGFIGYLGTNIKGLDTAIEALSVVKKSFENFELHVLGGGDNSRWKDYANKLQVNENIKFHGFIPSGDPVFKWIDDIDIYIHPSRQEGLPRAVIEVMSRGCPVIASNVGGIPELLPKEHLHNPNDSKKLAEIIIDMIENRDKCIKSASENFHNAKLYTKNILDERRTKFWNEFKYFCSTK